MATQALVANGMCCVLLFYDVYCDKSCRGVIRFLFFFFLLSHITKFAVAVIFMEGKKGDTFSFVLGGYYGGNGVFAPLESQPLFLYSMSGGKI